MGNAKGFQGSAEDYEAWYSTLFGSYAHELEKELVLKFVGTVRGKRILDVGCGTGLYTEILSDEGGSVIGIDPSMDMLRIARGRARASYLRASAEALPFKDGAFDVVVSVLALCFVSNVGKALSEMRRAVRRGGRLVMAVLNKWSSYAIQKRLVSKFRPSIYAKARFFDFLEIKGLGARRWDSVLFAQTWMPASMLEIFKKFEGALSEAFKPFGTFIVFER